MLYFCCTAIVSEQLIPPSLQGRAVRRSVQGRRLPGPGRVPGPLQLPQPPGGGGAAADPARARYASASHGDRIQLVKFDHDVEDVL